MNNEISDRQFPKVLIIILNWNNAPDTINCLDSLRNIDYPNYEIVLIDNGSVDGSVEKIRGLFPEIKIVENEENLGVAGGRNVGIDLALEQINDDGTETPEYVLFLDNDTKVDRGFLTEMVKVAKSDPRIGVLNPKIYYSGQPTRIWAVGGRLNFSRCDVTLRGIDEYDEGQYDEICDIDWALGCGFLITKDVLGAIGGFDPIFGVYCDEEIDWCIRAKKAGYRIVYVPRSQIWHLYSKTMPGSNYYCQKVRNHLILMRRYASLAQWLSFMFLSSFIIIRAVIRQMRHGNIKNIVYMFRGLGSSLLLKPANLEHSSPKAKQV